MENYPSSQHQDIIDAYCHKYPTWFIEVLTEVPGKPGMPLRLEPFQIAYLLDDSRFKITNKTRQAGGSLIVSAAKFVKAYQNEGYNCDIVSINRAEAQGKITYIKSLWESLPRRWQHPLDIDTYERIAFHSGRRRSTIRSIAASAGVRGGRKDMFFDEAAHIPQFEPLFVAALPATIRDGGQFDVVSTPMGRQGQFWKIHTNQAGKFDQWSRHDFIWIDVSMFCRDPEAARRRWLEEHGGDLDALTLGQSIFEEFALPDLRMIAESMTVEQFKQEFCGEFVDETLAFFPYDLIDYCRVHAEKQPNIDDYLEPWHARPEGNDNECYLGIDFAEGKPGGDSTSIQLLERDGDILKHRFYDDLGAKGGWNDFDRQLAHINAIIERFQPQRVSLDATGLGVPLAKDLKKKWGGSRIDAVTFGNANKGEMALDLKKLMETRRIWLQHDNTLLKGQIHGIKRTITAHGNIQYSGEPFDDMFWALALAAKGTSRARFRIYTLHDQDD